MEPFDYRLTSDFIVFTDTLYRQRPCHYLQPRNHESLFLITDGTLLYQRDGKEWILSKGQVGYIARGSRDISGSYSCDSVSYIAINFNFDRESAEPFPTLPFDPICSKGTFDEFETLFHSLLDCFMMKKKGYQTICKGFLLQIIGQLYCQWSTPEKHQRKLQQIKKGLLYLEEHYEDPALSITALAEACNMSEKNFRRVFTELYAKTPFAFLQEFRIRKSKILLAHTQKRIEEIAVQCGFSDVYSFSHCFKRHTAMSPFSYRKKQESVQYITK